MKHFVIVLNHVIFIKQVLTGKFLEEKEWFGKNQIGWMKKLLHIEVQMNKNTKILGKPENRPTSDNKALTFTKNRQPCGTLPMSRFLQLKIWFRMSKSRDNSFANNESIDVQARQRRKHPERYITFFTLIFAWAILLGFY